MIKELRHEKKRLAPTSNIKSGPLGTKNRSSANCVPIYGDLYQNLHGVLPLI